MPEHEKQNPFLIRAIMAGVLAWGLMLAIGAALHSAGFYNFDSRRGVIVFACVLAFLGFWVLMLRHRARTTRDDEAE